jgi:hypothetical protein
LAQLRGENPRAEPPAHGITSTQPHSSTTRAGSTSPSPTFFCSHFSLN